MSTSKLPCSAVGKDANEWRMLILIVFLAIIPFWPSLSGTFVFDDTEAVVRNADVRNRSRPLLEMFTNDFWGKSLTAKSSHKSYRPLTVLSFRWNYAEKLEPKPFHILNVVFHSLACVLLWFVFGLLLNEDSKRNVQSGLSTRTVATMLFAVHPVHTENVAGIVGRADVLAAICFFTSFLLYSHFIHLSKSQGFIYHMPLFCSFLVISFTSMLFKENGITVLGFCIIYDLINAWPFNGCNKKLFGRIAGVATAGICILTFRWWIMGGTMPTFQSVDNPSAFVDSLLQRVLNYNYIYAVNVWILLCPTWLCFDWSMGCISLIQRLSDLRVLGIVFLWVILARFVHVTLSSTSSWTYKRKLANAVVLTILPFLPASNLFMTVGFVVAERVLYLTSAGFCLIVAIGFDILRQHFRRFKLFELMFTFLVVIFALRSWQRSGDWNSEEKLFTSGVSVCPSNAKIHYNIAKNAADNGQPGFAIKKYREALQLHPRYEQAMNNLANLLKDSGNIDEAEKILLNTVQIRPDFAAAWMNLGIVQAFLKKHKEAQQSYLTALIYRPNYPDCLYNLGNLFLDLKLYNLAYGAWRNATTLKQTHVGSWNNMVIMFDNIGDLKQAKMFGEEAVNALPNEAFVYFNLANVLGKLGDFQSSERNFLKAISINNTNSIYYTNLGVLYHRWKRYDEAIEAYQNALRINPNIKSASENLLRLLPQREN